MDFGIISKVIGILLLIESAFMLPSVGISLYYGEADTVPFLVSIAITAFFGFIGCLFKPKNAAVRYREGFMIVGLGWILASVFGALPFLFAGTFPSFIDALFESVSGFTTTGGTVLSDVESLPHGILFWRSLTHWLGGMGILVITLSVLPAMGLSTIQIYRAESPGPSPDKLAPKIGQTAKLLYIVYLIITVIQVIALKIAGMPLFDSITHTFGTVGTGGFSIKNASIGAYENPVYEWIIIIFMFLAAINFSLYYDALRGNFRSLLKDSEFRFYSFVVITSIILIAVDVYGFFHNNLGEAIRHSAFQVSSLISTTGYASVNYDLWPEFSKMILFVLMFFGGCAGSTAGGIKQIRILLIFKVIKRELYKLIHPRAVISIRLGDKTVSEGIIQSIMGFFMLYILIFAGVSLLLMAQGMDIVSSTSAVVAALSNVGPGFNIVGPAMNYGGLSNLAKILLTACMLLGRLEIYTLLVLLMPSFWKD